METCVVVHSFGTYTGRDRRGKYVQSPTGVFTVERKTITCGLTLVTIIQGDFLCVLDGEHWNRLVKSGYIVEHAGDELCHAG